MDGRSHYRLAWQTAPAAWWVVAHHLPAAGAWAHRGELVAFTAASTITAWGWLSPDMDNAWWWQAGDRAVDDEALQRGGPLQHRGITHWWGLPVLVSVVLAGALMGAGPVTVACAQGAVWGWVTHLVGDLVCGRAWVVKGVVLRGPGIPVFPWWGHVGFGMKSDGRHTPRVVNVLTGLTWTAAVLVAW